MSTTTEQELTDAIDRAIQLQHERDIAVRTVDRLTAALRAVEACVEGWHGQPCDCGDCNVIRIVQAALAPADPEVKP